MDEETEIIVDGTSLPINPFVKKIFYNAIVGMVKSLKQVDSAQKIEIKILV